MALQYDYGWSKSGQTEAQIALDELLSSSNEFSSMVSVLFDDVDDEEV